MHNLVEVKKHIHSIMLNLIYATDNNFTGIVLYQSTKAYIHKDLIERLKLVQSFLIQRNLSLVIWDAYRPFSISEKLWEYTPESQKQYVADPSKGSNHNRGCALDVTLYNLDTQQYITMPSEFDTFNQTAHPNYSHLSSLVIKNRNILRSAMESDGFQVNPNEWWHYDWLDCESYPILNTLIEDL